MISARYDAKCPGCGEPIREGDEIGLVDDEWVCRDCLEDAEIADLAQDED